MEESLTIITSLHTPVAVADLAPLALDQGHHPLHLVIPVESQVWKHLHGLTLVNRYYQFLNIPEYTVLTRRLLHLR